MIDKRKIKVLHVAPLPPPMGGMVSYIQGLLGSDVFKTIDYKVVRLNILNKEEYSGIVRIIVNYLNSFLLTINYLFMLIFWSPDIVHIQSNSGLGFFEKMWLAFLGKLLGRKTIVHVHGGNMRDWYHQSSSPIQKLIRKSASINDRIMTGSPQMKETWQIIGLPDEKITYVGNAVNLPSEITKIPKDNLSILFLTRVVLEKGIIELIDAFILLSKEYPDLELRIVGADTKDTVFVKKYLEEKDEKKIIKYIGSVTDEQKHQEYLYADIFAFPTYIEDQSYAIMEAMSYGLPCVASNVGGVPSLIQDGVNGLLIKPKDVNSLKEGLNSLILDGEKRYFLGRNAHETIENGFTWEVRSKEIVELYKSIIQKTNHS
ncbi:MAG TPA: hypothetical protein DF698_06585 [Candidatus Atribacteria bacterium]|jgi:glycosyltransferase involved in cell wall biosynthesis|nr:hypothetical protein [Candidatus Atribacteria bacterium]